MKCGKKWVQMLETVINEYGKPLENSGQHKVNIQQCALSARTHNIVETHRWTVYNRIKASLHADFFCKYQDNQNWFENPKIAYFNGHEKTRKERR